MRTVLLWILQIFYKTFFCRTPPVVASHHVSTGKQLSLLHIRSYIFVFTLPPSRLGYVINKWPLSLTAKLMEDIVIKGYLRYKTITSQNVSSKAQIKNFFIS